MGSFTVWHWVILLFLGGVGYALYLIVRPERAERRSPSHRSNVDGLYEIVAEELRNNSIKQGIWAKAFAEADGNDSKARAAYIRYRVAQLEAEHSSERAPPGPDPQVTPSNEVPRWKKTARFIGIVFTCMLVAAGIIGFLLVAMGGDFENPKDRRLGGQAGFYAVVGIGILSAVYAPRRKSMWFLIGSAGAYIGLLTAATVIRLVRNLSS